MNTRAGLVVALLVVLAGCNVGFNGTQTADPTTSTAGPTTTTAANASGNFSFADPAADRLGWEDGYWYNESVPVNATDGERGTRALVARTMARVERIRGLEFQQRVPVEVVSRTEYRERFGAAGDYTASYRAFDNAKFEAMFLVGENEDSIAVQNRNRGSNVLGFYSPANDTIVVVSEDGSPTFDGELTLGHELVHALQDQHFNLQSYERPTRERYNAYNGLFEGDAHYVQQRYGQRCDAGTWNCVQRGSNKAANGSQSLHLGVYVLNYFAYSDGPNFVRYVRERGGWDAVNALYDDPPATTAQVIDPASYGTGGPADVRVRDTARNGWERLRPESPDPNRTRAPYASLGQSGVAATFAYTLYDSYNQSSVVDARAFLNVENGGLNSTDPFEYGFDYADGWTGDRLHVYRNPDAGRNETAYVWRLAWESPAEAEEFAAGYRALLGHYGGERVGENTWRIDDGPFADAFYVRVDGDTVTVVNAPTVEALSDVSAEAR